MRTKSFTEVCLELRIDSNNPAYVSADSLKLPSFVRYYINNIQLMDNGTKFELIELIISSMNEAMLNNFNNPKMEKLFKDFVVGHVKGKDVFEILLLNYLSMIHDSETPVALLIDGIK